MRLNVSEQKWIEVDKQAEQRIEKAKSKDLCLACLEPMGDDIGMRGCHSKCYRATMRAIERGWTTDNERVQEGKLGERKPPGRKPLNPVTRELKESRN